MKLSFQHSYIKDYFCENEISIKMIDHRHLSSMKDTIILN